MQGLLRRLILAVGLVVVMLACGALAYSVWPVARQTEQVRPPATLFAPP